jgi:polysaccharide transporter, PST family
LKTYFDKIKNTSNFRAILANIGWLFFDRVLRMGLGLYITLCIARYLGASQFGLLNYATAFATMFWSISTLGLESLIVHRLVNNLSPKGATLSTVFWLRCLGGLISIILAVCVVFIFRHDDTSIISLVAILAGVGIIQPFDTIDLLFQSQLNSKYTVIAKNTAFILAALLRLVLINSQAPLIAFALVVLIEAVLGAMGLVILFKNRGNSIRFLEWDGSLAYKLLKEGFPLILSSLSVMIYLRIDQLMLGEMVGEKAVGIYSAATRISEVWYFVPIAITTSIAPSIYAAKNNNSEEVYNQKNKRFIQLMIFISLLIAIPMNFLSTSIVVKMFGDDYVEAGQILSIHIWSAVFVFMGVASSPWFVAEKLTRLSLYKTLLGASTNIILNFILIPSYEGLGSAIATVISYSISDLFSNIIHPETRKLLMIQVKSIFFFL